ncbi:RHS repeat domain-containing protein [Erwiniaceae bacterium CAU 1747]
MSDIPVPTLAALDRHYGYDAAQNLVSVNDDAERLSYVVNGNHQVVSVSSGRTLRESYRYDACGYPAQGDSGTGQAVGHDDIYRRGHRLNRLGRHGYEYDAAGRMTARRLERDGYRPEYTRFVWNTQNQLVALQDGQGRKWTYRYDSRGRRTEKRCEAAGLRTAYLWDGDTVAEIREYRDESLQRVRHQVFQGYELTALQEWRRERPEWRTYFAVSAPTGQPLALFDTAGKCVWRRARESLWGEVPGKAIQNAELDPGLKFAGQQWDEESGLCYNRYRYYCAESKCYLTPDPIGLAGGMNPYSYVHNPLGWIDPLGLSTCPNLGKADDAILGPHGTLKNDTRPGQSHHLNQDAAFRDVIPTNSGAAIKLEGNAFTQPGTPHYEAHKSLGQFWNQYRRGGALSGQHPTNLQYTQALKHSLESAGLSANQVNQAVRSSIQNRIQYGLLGGQKVSRIPGRINQVKL